MYRLTTPPDSLDELGDSLSLLENMQKQIPEIGTQFEPIQDQFNMLEKYEVAIPEQVQIFLSCNDIVFYFNTSMIIVTHVRTFM